jgi:hypothetical protein
LRTTQVVLTEEAHHMLHHMFVGETGLSGVIKRTLEFMAGVGADDSSARTFSEQGSSGSGAAIPSLRRCATLTS